MKVPKKASCEISTLLEDGSYWTVGARSAKLPMGQIAYKSLEILRGLQ